MSQENVEIVQAIYSAWEVGGSARPFLHDDVEYVNPSYAVERGTRRGPRAFGRVNDSYEEFSIRTDRFIDAGDEVVVLAWFTARGRGSGVPMEGEHGYVWTVKGGKAVRFRWFQSHAEALEAGGIEG